MAVVVAGTQTRLDAANEAIVATLQPLACANGGTPGNPDCDDPLSAAAIMFPSAPGVCAVDPLTSSEQIPWQGASAFIDTWQTYWTTHPSLWGTPLAGALELVDQELTSSSRPGNTAVLVVTDGQLTCGFGHADPIALANSWHARGVSTYVISLAGASVAPGSADAMFNDSLAAAGGTVAALNPTDTPQLVDALHSVLEATTQVAGCDVALDGGMLTDLDEACRRGDVAIDGSFVACDGENGFQVVAHDAIRLFGTACEGLQNTGHSQRSFPAT